MQQEMQQAAKEMRCSDCGRLYRCDPQGDCWCKSVDLRLPLPASTDAACLCPCRLEALAKPETLP